MASEGALVLGSLWAVFLGGALGVPQRRPLGEASEDLCEGFSESSEKASGEASEDASGEAWGEAFGIRGGFWGECKKVWNVEQFFGSAEFWWFCPNHQNSALPRFLLFF